MTPPVFDVAIVGAGIVGAACAAECAGEGLRVVVIEGEAPGAGATGAAMGHVVAMGNSEAQFALTRFSQDLWERAAGDFPPDVDYQRCGTVWIAADEEEMALAERMERFYRGHGVEVRLLDAQALAGLEPELRKGLQGGLYVPGDRVLEPLPATRFLLQRARARGATLRVGQPAAELGERGVRLRDGSAIAAERTVNAAGCSAPLLTPGLGVRKRKGHLILTDRYPGFLRHQLVELGYVRSTHPLNLDSVALNLQPKRSGEVVIGSSRQYGAEGGEVDPIILRRMVDRATEYMPGLAGLSHQRAWVGFRPASPDGLPLIGLQPGRDHIFLATGHEGLGITTSLGTARLLVDILLGRPSAIPVDPYLPSRLEKVSDRA